MTTVIRIAPSPTVLHLLRDDDTTMKVWLPSLARLQAISQMVLIGTFAAACDLLIESRDTSFPPQRLAATVFFVLALAEYVNYYHVQV